LFAGYSSFRDVPRLERLAARFARLPSLVRRPIAATLAAGGKSDRRRKISEFAGELATNRDSALHPYFLVRSLFPPSERQALYANSHHAERELAIQLQPSIAATTNLDPVNRVSFLESHWYMRNTLLRDSDFMSMAHGLELRVPFLDRDLVEACFRIPGGEKHQAGSPKPLLLRNLGVELPEEIVNRPKRGFTLPFEHWLRAEMRPIVEKALTADNSCDLIAASGARFVWQRFLAGETSWSRPWSLFVLQRWCEQNL
jgi:asparagine synthase (glutamine-hydrolysing)